MATEVADKWLSMASGKYNIQYIVSIDTSEPQIYKYQGNIYGLTMKYAATKEKITIGTLVRENKTAIEAINVAAELTSFDLMIVVSDDFDCFQNWDEWLLERLKGQKDFVVKTSDGIQDRLITLPILDRTYYKRFGYIYYAEYQHLFCDTEMTEVGHLLGKVIDLRDEQHAFIHKHHSAGLMVKDSINEKNDATWAQGEALYNSRKANNFGLVINEPIPVMSDATSYNAPVIDWNDTTPFYEQVKIETDILQKEIIGLSPIEVNDFLLSKIAELNVKIKNK